MIPRPLVAILVLAVVLSVAPAAVSAQTAQASLIDPLLYQDPAFGPDAAASDTAAILIILEGPTTLDVLRGAGWTGGLATEAVGERVVESAFETVARQQRPARDFVEASGAEILSTFDTIANGFLAYATPDQVRLLASTPGLAGIYPAPYHVPLLEDAVPQIGAVEVAENLGFSGQGVTIGIIDTGTDYTHKNLGGSGRKQDYDRALQNPVRAEGLFPNSKVVGGYDFAGTDYTGGNTPVPDEDPIDEAGHGSHVSGITAGAEGNPKLFHGVAKDALLLGLKVFGARGGTNLAMSAVEWAAEVNVRGRPANGEGMCRISPCHVDVVNMSLGSAFANNVAPQAAMIKNATDAGVVVVASAGNNGDVGYITGAPAAARHALSVASTWASGEVADVVKVYYDDGSLLAAPLAPVEEDLEAIEASDTLAPQVKDSPDIRERLGWFGRGCNGDRQEGDVTERVALIERGNCAFKEKLDNAETAGAVAAVVFTDNRAVTTMGTNTGKANIVAFMITRPDGLRLRDLIMGGTAVEVGLSKQNKGAFDRSYMTDVISSFSSRGPSMPGAFKPNIAAPGSRINSVARGSGDGGTKLDGTSMSSPVVAGAAAVLVSRARADGLAADGPLTGDEGLSAIDIGALLVNGADATVWDGDARDGVPVALARGGAGRVDLSASARLETVVRAGTRRADDEATPFGIMFGMKVFDDVITDERPFFVRNASAEERHYRVDTTFLFADDAASGVEFSPSEPEFTLGPGEVKDLTLDLRADPAAMKEWAAYGGARANWSAGMTPAEHDAFVVVTEVDADGNPVADGDVSRLPVYLLPRGTSEVAFESETLAVSPKDGKGFATVANTGGQPGRVDVFTLIGEDGDEGDVVDALDIDKVGARVTEDDEGNPVVEVLVHTVGPRQAPLDTRTFVGIDTDMNGSLDYMAFTTDVSYWPSPQCQNPGATISGPQIVVVAAVGQQNPLSWSCQDWTADYFAGVDLGARSVVLPVAASSLGFEEGEAIAFDAIVLHTVFLPGVVPQGSTTQEVAPDDGVSGNGVGPGRYHFDEDALGVTFDPPGIDVPAGGSAEIRLTKVESADTMGPALAYFVSNMLDADVAMVDIEERIVMSRAIYLPALKFGSSEAP